MFVCLLLKLKFSVSLANLQIYAAHNTKKGYPPDFILFTSKYLANDCSYNIVFSSNKSYLLQVPLKKFDIERQNKNLQLRHFTFRGQYSLVYYTVS